MPLAATAIVAVTSLFVNFGTTSASAAPNCTPLACVSSKTKLVLRLLMHRAQRLRPQFFTVIPSCPYWSEDFIIVSTTLKRILALGATAATVSIGGLTAIASPAMANQAIAVGSVDCSGSASPAPEGSYYETAWNACSKIVPFTYPVQTQRYNGRQLYTVLTPVDNGPHGYLESCNYGTLAGWARDDDNEASLRVDFYEGGKGDFSHPVGSVQAGDPSEDAIGGNHHHRFNKPASELNLTPGAHDITAYAIGVDKNGNLNGNNPALRLLQNNDLFTLTCYR